MARVHEVFVNAYLMHKVNEKKCDLTSQQIEYFYDIVDRD